MFLFQARDIYEKAVEFFGEEYMDEKLFIAFAQFEEAQKVTWHFFKSFNKTGLLYILTSIWILSTSNIGRNMLF